MKIEKIYAIETTGSFPIALVRYEGCSPDWRQYDKDIQEHLSKNKNYEINSNKKISEPVGS